MVAVGRTGVLSFQTTHFRRFNEHFESTQMILIHSAKVNAKCLEFVRMMQMFFFYFSSPN